MEELKPCPFCGRKPDMQKAINYKGVYVVCHSCEIRTFIFASERAAAERWNRRANDV